MYECFDHTTSGILRGTCRGCLDHVGFQKYPNPKTLVLINSSSGNAIEKCGPRRRKLATTPFHRALTPSFAVVAVRQSFALLYR
mmetsp:Transcript_123263/g.343176  ORF Transcript_123263/g.343176 Transcript_123263/m.343176 type:complete len:84 (+) Transcript_123263:93-344(+)